MLKPRVNVMPVSACENMDFEEIVLKYLCPRYQLYISYFS